MPPGCATVQLHRWTLANHYLTVLPNETVGELSWQLLRHVCIDAFHMYYALFMLPLIQYLTAEVPELSWNGKG